MHALHKERAGQHAIWVNDKYRVCFTWKDGHAYASKLPITMMIRGILPHGL
ncbi:MAG: hypothetical protein ACRD4F_08530 [Candidatus Angelobacter sp.]